MRRQLFLQMSVNTSLDITADECCGVHFGASYEAFPGSDAVTSVNLLSWMWGFTRDPWV